MNGAPDVRVAGSAARARVEVDASGPLFLTPRAARELARQLTQCAAVAEDNAVSRRNAAGDAVTWSDEVGFLLSAFVPRGSIEHREA